MTSKEYLLSREKLDFPPIIEIKRKYALRPIKIKQKEESLTSLPYKKNGRRFRNLNGAEPKRPSTPNPLKKMGTKKSKSQETASNDIDMSNLSPDWPCLSEMEDEAFRLARFVESNDSFDQIISETLSPNPIPASTVNDSSIENNFSLNQMELDELLDLSIKELESIGSPSACSSPNPIPNRINKNGPVDNPKCTQERTDTIDRTNRHGTDQLDRNNANQISMPVENSSKRHKCVSLSEREKPIMLLKRVMVHKNAQNNKRARKSRTMKTVPNLPPTVRNAQTPQSNLHFNSNSTAASHQTSPYATLSKNVAMEQQTFRLFNRPCMTNLNGRCTDGGRCKWNHNLPKPDVIHRKLMHFFEESVSFVYTNFVLRYDTVFVAYFPIMCEVFGKRKMQRHLMRAINDCEKRERVRFIKFVYNGIIVAGSTKRDALCMIMERCSKSRDCYDLFLEIMIETGALDFVDLIKKFYMYGTINATSIHILLQQVANSPSALLPLFIDILDKYSVYNAIDGETFDLILPIVKNLVHGNLSLAQKLDDVVAQRIK